MAFANKAGPKAHFQHYDREPNEWWGSSKSTDDSPYTSYHAHHRGHVFSFQVRLGKGHTESDEDLMKIIIHCKVNPNHLCVGNELECGKRRGPELTFYSGIQAIYASWGLVGPQAITMIVKLGL